MLRWIKEMLVLNMLLVPPMIFFPAICWGIALNSSPWRGYAAMACLVAAPFASAVWCLVYSQWSSAMVWQRMGRLQHWREDHGGLIHTVPRACGWMFWGLLGSIAAEVLYCRAFYLVPHCETRLSLFMWLLPFVALSPVFPIWCWRRVHP